MVRMSERDRDKYDKEEVVKGVALWRRKVTECWGSREFVGRWLVQETEVGLK